MSSSETRVLWMSMPALRALLRASPGREWTVEEIAAHFGGGGDLPHGSKSPARSPDA